MIKIYHNPRCSKSRQGLEIVENSELPFEVIRYLDSPLTKSELSAILDILAIAPIDLVRKGEIIWKELYKGKELSDDELIEAMVTHPKLIERPIVINNNTGVIGRPPESIKDIL